MGTDVAGGYSTSILDAARQAIIASRCVSFTEKDEEGRPYEALSLDEVSGCVFFWCVCVQALWRRLAGLDACSLGGWVE